MDSKIISEAIKPDILELLHNGQFETILSKLQTSKRGIFNLINFSKKDSNFSYQILYYCLIKKINPTRYSKVAKLDFKSDFLTELTELHRILLVLNNNSKEPEVERLIALTLLEVIKDGASYIAKNSNNYPQGSINAKIWIDGAGLRTRADELSNYFENQNDNHDILEALYLRAQLTNTVMSHYPGMIGPDMIAVSSQFEKMGNIEKAKLFLHPVVLDFTILVEEVEKGIIDNEVMDEDIAVTQSLINALEGLKRLGESIDENVLIKSKQILKKLNEINDLE